MLKSIKSNVEHWVSSNKKRLSNEKATKKLTMCKKCYTFYYKNNWHFEKPSYLGLDEEEEIRVHFTECPACLEQEAALYEGEAELVWGMS